MGGGDGMFIGDLLLLVLYVLLKSMYIGFAFIKSAGMLV